MRAALSKLLDTFCKSSWCSSTLSQMAMMSVFFYTVGALALLIKRGDIAPLKWGAEIFGASYLTARSAGGQKADANGEPKP